LDRRQYSRRRTFLLTGGELVGRPVKQLVGSD